jgi:hypothetical protein
MDAIFGMELPLIVKFVLSFAIVLVLIGAAALLVRKFGGRSLIPGAAPRGRQPRLAVIDTAPVDSRRSLVIVRRDNVEHLLLIGGPTDVLVESNIISVTAAQPVRAPEAELRTPVVQPRVPVVEPEVAAKAAPAVVSKPELAVPVMPPVASPVEVVAVEPPPETIGVPEQPTEPRVEPVLMPEPRREPEVREPTIPVFVSSSPPPLAPVQIEAQVPEAFDEPHIPEIVPAAVAPPITVTPPPPPVVSGPRDLDEPLARFTQELNAHRDHMNGRRQTPLQTSTSPTPPMPPAPPVQAPVVQPPVPAAATAPARSFGPSADEESLANMAQRLEAALRRPLGVNGTRSVPQQQPAPQPMPRVNASVTVRQAEPLRRASAGAPPIPPQPAAVRPVPQGPTVVSVPQQAAEDTATYENLQREMASLLGRKPGSS